MENGHTTPPVYGPSGRRARAQGRRFSIGGVEEGVNCLPSSALQLAWPGHWDIDGFGDFLLMDWGIERIIFMIFFLNFIQNVKQENHIFSIY